MIALPLAHALVARQDLPVPAWLFAWGASIVLVLSFVVLTSAWRVPRFERQHWRALGAGLSRALLAPSLQALCGAFGAFLLGFAIYAGLRGTQAPDRNFSLTFFYVTAWLGFPFLSAILGDLFRPFNPWRAIGRACGAAFEAVAGKRAAHLPCPERLGRWPAAIGLVAVVWLEVVYGGSGGVAVGLDPQAVALAASLYTAYTLAMMAVFGVEEWCRCGEVFSVYFGMFGRLGIFGSEDGRLGTRRPLSAATSWAVLPGSAAVVIASIATTSFDGGQEGAFKQVLESMAGWFEGLGAGVLTAERLADTVLIFVCCAGVGLVYLLGVRGMRGVRGAPPESELRAGFAHTLIPIALAYLLAHYFSLFVFQEQAQFTYLLSDPLGTGHTDLFGTASSGIDFTALSAAAIWYVQVGGPDRRPRARPHPRPRPRPGLLEGLSPGFPLPVLDARRDGQPSPASASTSSRWPTRDPAPRPRRPLALGPLPDPRPDRDRRHPQSQARRKEGRRRGPRRGAGDSRPRSPHPDEKS